MSQRGINRQPPSTAVSYLRLSRRKDKKLMSVAEQEKRNAAEADGRSLTVLGTYADDGISGFKRVARPGFTDMLRRIEGGDVGYVIMVADDRADRRMGALVTLVEMCQDTGTMLIMGGNELDPVRDVTEIYQGGVYAMKDSVTKSVKVLAAKEVALERGLYNGGRTPIGYKKLPGAAAGYWVQDDEVAPAIRDGARMILDGASLAKVAKEWNDRGIPRTTGGAWTQSKVRRTLLSPIVAGLRTHNGEIVGTLMRPDDSPWPAILSRETRDEIDRVLRSRAGRRPERWYSPNPGLLSGIVTCGVCGNRLTPRRYGGRRADMYTCQADGGMRCGTIGVTQAHVDALITEAALIRLEKPSAQLRAAFAKPKRRVVDRGDDPDLLQAEIDVLADAVGRGEITAREFLNIRKPLQERIDRAQANIDTDDDLAVLGPMLARGVDVRDQWEARDFDGKRAILAALFDRVVVKPAGSTLGGKFDPKRISVKWRDAT
jgi:DNA invertase Pin-like site-specific DNA recombinase